MRSTRVVERCSHQMKSGSMDFMCKRKKLIIIIIINNILIIIMVGLSQNYMLSYQVGPECACQLTRNADFNRTVLSSIRSF